MIVVACFEAEIEIVLRGITHITGVIANDRTIIKAFVVDQAFVGGVAFVCRREHEIYAADVVDL